ncbi:MAG: glycosyltransferase [Candidatus Auribacter fodinae]|jgi:glycosyltransferase involved in cell wall biosynthesis|uniref:Glycosyltransferase n=1 Tax=Candidatus Auribacter fodinae TaxID=2093366 RepID=A0A3A4QQF6_9BACT|nr:MAG: glycosyltransferase [Candidatus Auribacter fodinae]
MVLAKKRETNLKILHLTTDSAIGGTEKMIIQVAGSLNDRGFVSYVVSLKPGLPLKEQCSKMNITCLSVEMRSKFDISALFRLYALIRDIKPDILHTYLFHSNILGRIIGRIARVPVIISGQRNVDLWRKWYHNIIDRISSRFCRYIIANSYAGQRFLIDAVRMPPAKVMVIHNGVDFQSVRSSFTNTAYQNKPLTLVTVASLTRKKGHEFLFEALKTKRGKWLLILVGTGREKERLKQLCEEYGLCDKINFAGFKTEIRSFLEQADIFILPSLWEGLPVALMEAMAFGCACVATDVGGVPELISDRQNGLLVPPGDSQALRNAIDCLHDSPDMRVMLGQAAAKTIREHFSVRKMIDTLSDVYTVAVEDVQR